MNIHVLPYARQAGYPAWLLGIEDSDGNVGWGDCAPWPGFGSWPYVDALRAALTDPWATRQLPVEAANAVESALIDLRVRRSEPTTWRPSPGASPPRLQALVHTPDEAARAVQAGAHALKVKVGAGSLGQDDARLDAIRERVGRSVLLRLDANGAWDIDGACRALAQLERHGLDWVEQPVRGLWGLVEVRTRSGVRVAADEDVSSLADLEELEGAGGVDALVIKPMFVGGPAAARALAAKALGCGLEVVISAALASEIDRRWTRTIAQETGTSWGPGSLRSTAS